MRFDVAVVDHQMPVLDGPALAAVLRQRTDARRLPLLLLSSLGRRDPQSSATFASVLTRPLKASQLYDALVTCFSADPVAPRKAQPGRGDSAFLERLGDRLPLRILLAEDNVTNQKLALLVLERLGYRAEVAASGREALRSLARQRYDVILMDMQMPEMDGLEATRRIREEVPLAQQPWIIAMTANAMDSDRRLCLEAGMNDFLTKPLMVETLITALQRCQPQRSREPVGHPSHELALALQLTAPAQLETGLASVPGLDPVALSRLWSGLGEQAPTSMVELIDTALMSMPGLLGEARTALERGNTDDLGRAAHTLKSNAAYFGATALETVCREIERRADSRKLEGLGDMLTQCEAELSRTRMLLEQLRGRIPS
jgi:CheY-like chemotaxis protein/HPt (histidine-containing phosphotransfer) domain-containing protein